MKRCLLALMMMLGCSACGEGSSAVTAYYAISHNPAGSDWGITAVKLYVYFGASPSCGDLLGTQAPQATIYLAPDVIDDLRFKASETTYQASAWTYDFDKMMLQPAVKQRSCRAKFEVTIDRSPEFRGDGYTPAAEVTSQDDALVGSFKPMTIDEQPASMHDMPFTARHCVELDSYKPR